MNTPLAPDRKLVWSALTVVLVTALTMGRLVTCEFLTWDDDSTVRSNPDLNPPTMGSVLTYWTRIGPSAPAAIYIPLTYTVWGALAQISYLETPDEFGQHLNPYIFHLFNVLVHSATAVLVLLILLRLGFQLRAACIGAVAFAIHPVMVETVGWISGLKDLLFGLFTALSIWQWIVFRQESRRASLVMSLMACVLGMLSKPTGMVIPVLNLAVDCVVFQKRLMEGVKLLAPALLASVATAVIARWSQPLVHSHVVEWWIRPFIAGDALAFYLKKLLWPMELALDYGRQPDKVATRPSLWIVWVIPVGIAVCIWMFRKRTPLIALAGLIFLIGLAPVLGFVPFAFQAYSTVADHYLYVPMIGVAMLVGLLIERSKRRWMEIAFVIVLLLWAGRSFSATAHWKNTMTLFTHQIEVNSESVAAWNNLGEQWIIKQDWPKAVECYSKASHLEPSNPHLRENLAYALVGAERIDEAIVVLRESRDVWKQRTDQVLKPMADNKLRMGKRCEELNRPREAAEFYRAAIEDEPGNAIAVEGLKRVVGKSSTTKATGTK